MLRNTDWPDYGDVLTYIKNTQNPDGGWSVGEQTTSDLLTTAQVVHTLCRYQNLDPLLDTNIQNGETFLGANVTTASPALYKSQTIQALHPNGRYTTKVQDLVNSLLSDQDIAGHWDNNAYVTSSVLLALAAYLNNDPDAQAALCHIPDQDFRSGVNNALDKNDNDALTDGEIATLTQLYAAGSNISDLTGVGSAVNLTYADLSNNNITSLDPFHDHPNPETIQALLDGNPLSDQEDFDGDGWSDLAELNAGSNPLSASSVPSESATAVPASNLLTLLITAGILVIIGLRNQWIISMKKNQKKIFKVTAVSVLFLVMFCMVSSTNAKQETVLKKLPAGKLEKVKGVAQALLQAKRSYTPPEEIQKLRQEIKQLYILLDTLTKPMNGDTLQLNTMPVQAEDKKSRQDPWREKKSDDIEQLLQTANRIDRQSKDLVSKPSRNSKGSIMHKPALTRLGELKTECEQALALSDPERQKRLLEIKQQLKLSRGPVNRMENIPAKMPTMLNRTKHRPPWP